MLKLCCRDISSKVRISTSSDTPKSPQARKLLLHHIYESIFFFFITTDLDSGAPKCIRAPPGRVASSVFTQEQRARCNVMTDINYVMSVEEAICVISNATSAWQSVVTKIWYSAHFVFRSEAHDETDPETPVRRLIILNTQVSLAALTGSSSRLITKILRVMDGGSKFRAAIMKCEQGLMYREWQDEWFLNLWCFIAAVPLDSLQHRPEASIHSFIHVTLKEWKHVFTEVKNK